MVVELFGNERNMKMTLSYTQRKGKEYFMDNKRMKYFLYGASIVQEDI